MNEKKAIVLGGTSPHVELVKKLKARGYYTILIDYLTDSPCVEHADEHIKESTLDKEKVLEIAKSRNVDLVISTCIDQANSVCCYVAEKLDLPKPYSYKTSLDVTDKGLMKQKFMANEIPTSWFFIAESSDDICWDKISFPAVVKPVDCNSSKGVHKVENIEDAKRRIDEALLISRSKRAIIEGYNYGEEIQVDCFATNDDAKVLLTRQKKKIVSDASRVLQSTGSIIPADLDEKLYRQAKDIAKKIAKAFGLSNTPFFYQAIVTSNGISVLEFAPRLGGGLSYYVLNEIAGVDAIELAIDSFVGKNADFKVREVDRFYSTNLLYVSPCTFDHLEGFEKLKESGHIKEFFQMKKSGTVIDDELRSGNRVCAFVVEGDSRESVRELENYAYQNVKVIDANGLDKLYRTIIQ